MSQALTPANSWTIVAIIGDRQSGADAPDWRHAKHAVSTVIGAAYKAGILSEAHTRLVLESLTKAPEPDNKGLGGWFAASEDWRFSITMPLGTRL